VAAKHDALMLSSAEQVARQVFICHRGSLISPRADCHNARSISEWCGSRWFILARKDDELSSPIKSLCLQSVLDHNCWALLATHRENLIFRLLWRERERDSPPLRAGVHSKVSICHAVSVAQNTIKYSRPSLQHIAPVFYLHTVADSISLAWSG
jgi:hypothetical protein